MNIDKLVTAKGNGLFAVIGREEIQSEPFDDDFYCNLKYFPKDLVFISISDPNKDFIKTDNYFYDELKLKFWDVEEEIGKYAPIHLSQAKEIYDFIVKHKDRQFLINCEAGVSRSAGIALSVEYLLRDKELYTKWAHFPSKILQHFRYDPNIDVFSKIKSFDI